ncbi:hypothetical protein ACFCX4_20330 [Kitasatospora sp. NPDC056327]|uniref:hypothetical protein n=1 Tax=Kitasatospora sp. NPDC056327 TaxID=3345785 RepID=UPI0035D92B13
MTDESFGGPDPGESGPGHLPGDPTPVAEPPQGCLRAIGDFLLDLLGEAASTVLFGVLTTGSLAGVFVLAQLAYRQDPLLALALAVAAVLVVALGVWQLFRPKERRRGPGRIAAAVAAALGVWLLLCLGYASLSTALDLAHF